MTLSGRRSIAVTQCDLRAGEQSTELGSAEQDERKKSRFVRDAASTIEREAYGIV